MIAEVFTAGSYRTSGCSQVGSEVEVCQMKGASSQQREPSQFGEGKILKLREIRVNWGPLEAELLRYSPKATRSHITLSFCLSNLFQIDWENVSFHFDFWNFSMFD